MPITLSTIPGFSDLKDTALGANKFALGAFLSRVNVNASFGLVRLEFFTGIYKNGDVVTLPTSPVDGYTYNRSELIYLWVPANTADPATGWASYREPWTMWYGVWNVDQNTGAVFSEIGYRGNDDHKDRQASTNDGAVQVFVIAQRQKTGLIMATTPAFTRHVSTDFFTNRALHTGLIVDLNQAAKLSVCNTEVVYMGEFFNGQTVPNPVSPIDGHAYARTDCMFQTSWRWTADTDGSGNPIKPAINKGQLQDWSASVTASGLVQISNMAVAYELSGTHTYTTGKVAVFAFCTRSLGTTFLTAQTGFAEILDTVFAPGATLRASTMQQLNSNIGQALCSPEFFGPTNYSNGATIPVPTSPLDSYVYARSELFYFWDWANTGPSATGSGRLSLVHGSISAAGLVAINDYRLNSGASSVSLVHEGAMRVIVVGVRSHSYTNPVTTPGAPNFGIDDVIEFYGPNDRQTQYLAKADGSVTVSSLLNGQGSILPNQVISLTFTMPSPGTVLNVSWAAQSLLRPDGSFLNLVSSTNTIGANSVVDGDGESATVGSQAANWTFGAGNGLLGANDFVHSGTKALKIVNASAANSFSSQTISGLVSGKQYSIRGFIKTAGPLTLSGAGPGGALLHLSATLGGVTGLTQVSSAGGSVIVSSGTDISVGLAADGATVWPYTFVELTFVPTGSGSITLYIQSGLNGGVSGTAWFDDVALVPVGITYTGLSNSTHYYLYPYIETLTGLLKMVNGAPPGSSPSDSFGIQQLLDFRVQVAVKNILTPSAGSSGSDTGGGSGTCPEWMEPATVRRYSDDGELLFEKEITAGEVLVGYESDDGLMHRGDLIKGWSFAKNDYVWRAVTKKIIVPCSGWSLVKGRLLTPCEAVWWNGEWIAAWKTPGARQVRKISYKVLIEVEADWDDEHNYLVGDLIIHNALVLAC
jgi:hypothetical protein